MRSLLSILRAFAPVIGAAALILGFMVAVALGTRA